MSRECKHEFQVKRRGGFPGQSPVGGAWTTDVCVKCGISCHMAHYLDGFLDGGMSPEYSKQVRRFYQDGKARYQKERALFLQKIEEVMEV